MAKKRVEIEALLRWAFRDELPKAQAGRGLLPGMRGGWDALAKFGTYLTAIDEPTLNRWGVVPALELGGAPHPDAEVVAAAVEALDALELVLPDGWYPFADLGDLGDLGVGAAAAALERLTVDDADGRWRLRSAPSRLVFRQAVLGGCPTWEAETPRVRPLRGVHGQPQWFVRRMIVNRASDTPFEVELDGFDVRARRPLPDAYQKLVLDPSPVDAGVARGEYEIWRFALDVLVDDLAGALEDHEPTASKRAMRPWEGETRARTLADLTPPAWAVAAAQRPRRGRARRGTEKTA